MSDETTTMKKEKEPFNPKEHLTMLKSKQGEQEYLEVKWRLVWFHEQCPNGKITILHSCVDPNQDVTKEVLQWNKTTKANEKVLKTMKGFAWFHVRVEDGKGRVGEAIGSECALDFEDYPEKAQTKAMGRALAEVGYGTQFDPTLNELPRIVDAPVDPQPPQPDPPTGGGTKAKAPAPVATEVKTETTTEKKKETTTPVDTETLMSFLETAGPFERLEIFRTASISKANQTDPTKWGPNQQQTVLTWFESEEHDTWCKQPRLADQHTEVMKKWVPHFGKDAVQVFKDTLSTVKGTKLSEMTAGQADTLIDALRTAETNLVDGQIVQKRELVTV